NKSFRIVRDTYNTVVWQMTIAGTEDLAIVAGDTFVINGRPFSGTGFGFQLASFNSLVGNPIYPIVAPSIVPPATRMLDAMDPTPVPFAGGMLSSTVPQFLWPYALLPNHAKFTPQNPTGYALTPATSNQLLTTGYGWY